MASYYINMFLIAKYFLFVGFAINPLPHAEVFWCIFNKYLMQNIVAKEEYVYDEQFLPMPKCFQLIFI